MIRVAKSGNDKRYDIRLSGSLVNLLVVGVVGLLREHDAFRVTVMAIGAVSMLAGSFIVLFGRAVYYLQLFRDLGAPLFVAGFGLCLSAILAGPRFNLFVGEAPEVEERREAEENLSGSKDPYASLELDSKRLSEYYAINQSQARGSFRWAVFAMFCGLGTIVAGFWFYYLRNEAKDTLLTGLATAAGALVNLISGLYLYLHNKTQRRSLYYYGQLVRLQQLGLAIRLAESHETAAQRAGAKDVVIKELLIIARETALKDVASAAKEGSSDAG